MSAPSLFVVPLLALVFQVRSPTDHPAIAYSTTEPRDPVAQLQARLDGGESLLRYDPEQGYLPALLESLEIPSSSQSLVFSRTSLQVDRISPWTPRALYFNDDVYVGWVQGGPVIEIASVDPELGAVFYTLRQTPNALPRFEREEGTCLMCHDSSSVTGGVPGFIMRSVYPDRHGYPIDVRDAVTTDRTPLKERWGGWYVTGTPGESKHSGNSLAAELSHEVGHVATYLAKTDFTTGGNVTDLSDRFDPSSYLTRHSDIVAILLLAHQTHLHNAITRAGYEARKALYDEAMLLRSANRQEPAQEHLGYTVSRIEGAAEPLVRALLFSREAKLEGPVRGTSGFASEFEKRGPFDGQGRTLRAFDLETRLFRYPLSFLIYSESFDALPDVTKQFVFRRLRDVLEGKDTSAPFAHLSSDDRKAILEILSETKPELRVR